jgi:hypothetical protein
MLTFFATLLADLLGGGTQKHLDAADAFDSSPRNASAGRCRRMALGLFLMSSILLLSAALIHTMADRRLLSSVLGWSGIVALLVRSWLGRRYAILNS